MYHHLHYLVSLKFVIHVMDIQPWSYQPTFMICRFSPLNTSDLPSTRLSTHGLSLSTSFLFYQPFIQHTTSQTKPTSHVNQHIQIPHKKNIKNKTKTIFHFYLLIIYIILPNTTTYKLNLPIIYQHALFTHIPLSPDNLRFLVVY